MKGNSNKYQNLNKNKVNINLNEDKDINKHMMNQKLINMNNKIVSNHKIVNKMEDQMNR